MSVVNWPLDCANNHKESVNVQRFFHNPLSIVVGDFTCLTYWHLHSFHAHMLVLIMCNMVSNFCFKNVQITPPFVWDLVYCAKYINFRTNWKIVMLLGRCAHNIDAVLDVVSSPYRFHMMQDVLIVQLTISTQHVAMFCLLVITCTSIYLYLMHAQHPPLLVWATLSSKTCGGSAFESVSLWLVRLCH